MSRWRIVPALVFRSELEIVLIRAAIAVVRVGERVRFEGLFQIRDTY